MTPAEINPGALNLLVNCAGVLPGDTILLAVESSDHGFYADDLAPCVIAAAQYLGCEIDRLDTGFDPEARAMPKALLERAKNADVIVSLSRYGDQLRFDALPDGLRSVQCYALDATTLGTSFGTAPYAPMLTLRNAADDAFSKASNIRITCAKGTDVTGRAPPDLPPADTTCARFPLSVFSPILADGFSGQIALPGFLTGTGSRYYDSFTVLLPEGMFAHLDQGQLTGFSGPADGVRRANDHYDFVSERYGIERNAVHSWHAGLHPGCVFPGKIDRSFEAWSGSAFGNPRILHFHTCGASPPGEICWNVIDPTIEADGVRLWNEGVCQPHLIPGGHDLMNANPELARMFARPEQAIGL